MQPRTKNDVEASTGLRRNLMTLHRRLLLDGGVIITVVVLASAVAWWLEHTTTRQVRHLLDHSLPSLLVLTDMKAALVGISEAAFASENGADISDIRRETIEREERELAQRETEFRAGVERFRQLHASPQQVSEHQAFLSDLDTLSSELILLAHQSFRITQQGGGLQEAANTLESLEQTEASLESLLNDAIALEMQQNTVGQNLVFQAQNLASIVSVSNALLVPALIFALAARQSRNIALPLRRLSERVQAFGHGEFIPIDAPLTRSEPSEIHILAQSFEEMATELNMTMVSRDQFENILQSIRNVLIVVGRDEKIQLVNQAALDLLKYTKSELIGQPLKFILADQRIDETIARNPTKSIETELRARDGEIIQVSLTTTAVREGDKRVKRILCVAEDIRARKRSERVILAAKEEIERQKERVEAILNNTSDAIVLARGDGTIRQVNQAFIDMFGYQSEELLSESVASLVAGYDVDTFLTTLQKSMDEDDHQRVELTARRKDRSTYDADIATSVIRDGRVVKYVIISFRDISDRKAAEIERLQKEQMIFELEKMQELQSFRNRFMAMVSHEFRTPLTIIGTSSYILKRHMQRLKPDEVAERLTHVLSQVDRLRKMLDDVMTVTHSEVSQLPFAPDTLNLNTLCQQIVAEFSATIGARHNIILRVAEMSAMWADESLLRRVIANLLSNAVKYSPDGSAVHLDVFPRNGGCVIQVTDSGIGIPEEEQKYLFQPYFRAHNVGAVGGTGMGLRIAKDAVELHGGQIEVESHLNQGTTFRIYLPMIERDEATAASV
jgi:PAS domain S-box-containing protein